LKLVEEAAKAFGGVDVVVANAGFAQPASLVELTREGWDRMMNVNLRGPWLLARAAYEYLAASRGSFVAVASMSAVHPHAGSGAYSPAKAGLVMLTRTLALEWAPVGVRVNCVSPGMTRTPMTEKMYRDPGTNAARVALVPIGRIGKPDDIADAVVFLTSAQSAYITGENLTVDGGFSKTILSHIPGRPRSR
jgi:glucose 1-dehydrogenase